MACSFCSIAPLSCSSLRGSFICSLPVLFMFACGPRDSTKTFLSPDEAFSRLKPSPKRPLLCHSINGFGCGRISISNSSGEQYLTSENFLVSCSANKFGLSIIARDQAGIGPGLSYGVNIATVGEFSASSYVCPGLQLTNDPAVAKWRDKSCGVFVRYGESESWTIPDEPCKITIEKSDLQWRGVIDCPRVASENKSWIFNDPAVFTCSS